jgi:hypothetical protein
LNSKVNFKEKTTLFAEKPHSMSHYKSVEDLKHGSDHPVKQMPYRRTDLSEKTAFYLGKGI